MTREYGQEMLAMCEETEAVRQGHADYYLLLVEQAAQAWEGPLQAQWLRRLEQDHDNLRAVMQWSLEANGDRDRLEVAFRLGGALRSFWQVRGYFQEGRAFLESALSRIGESQLSRRAKVLNDAVLLAISQGDYEWGEALCQENLACCRELEDGSAIARALYLLGWSCLLRGHLSRAHSLLEESLAKAKEVNDTGGTLIALTWIAVTATYQGAYVRARTMLEQILDTQRQLANKRGMAWPHTLLAWGLFLSQSDPITLRTSLVEAERLFRELGDKWGIAECRRILGESSLEQGDMTAARTLLEQSAILFQEIGNRRGMAYALCLLGEVAARQQEWTSARALYEESLKEAKAVNDIFEIASCLEGIAGILAMEQPLLAQVLWAAQLWGAAEALREQIDVPLPPVKRAVYEAKVAFARRSIGKRIFSAYWMQGRTMTPEQALAAQGKTIVSSPPSIQAAPSLPLKQVANPGGLTMRELEVLCWVARGLTDAQIAAQLVISSRTVTSHLSSIYNKLGVASRAAATRFAIDHQLI
jgi:ATP/maltotriose-dependent transcriptional regulator MalT